MAKDLPSVGDGGEPLGDEAQEHGAPVVDEGGAPGDTSGGPKVYDEEYVKGLRDENAATRQRAKRAEEAENRLRASVIASATAGILQDPTDLPWSDELTDEDGYPDAEKITDAAEALVTAKPHLGRPRGDVGQGQRGDEVDAFSLTELIRSGV